MRSLLVPILPSGALGPWSALRERLSRSDGAEHLRECPWSAEFPYHPEVRFAIGHDGTSLYVAFRVRERSILGRKTRSNDAVSEDSCVELFISPEEDGLYYNFEFNCIGTCLAGVGKERHGRDLLPEPVIATIARRSSLGGAPIPAEKVEEVEWELLASIPASAFVRHRIARLSGRRMRANFYKCGDLLSVPHYVTWNPVESRRPDYHRPESFGELNFA